MNMTTRMNFKLLTNIELIAISEAARGGISGELGEWPVLREAFKKLNLPHSRDMDYISAKNLAILLRTSRSFISLVKKKNDKNGNILE